VRSFFLVLVLVGTLGFLAGCGGGGTPSGLPITITLTPSGSASVEPGQSLNIGATVTNDSSNQGVSWTLTGVGKLTNATSTSVTYTAPSPASGSATVVATSIASSSVTASLQITFGIANVLPVTVNGGLFPSTAPYLNGVFTTVKICVPNTATCQSIDNVLVDTGSAGLRLLASQVTIPLPVLADSNNNTLNDCIQFLDGSFLWGNVVQADIVLGGEVALATSVQSIATPGFSIPSGCTGTNEDTQQTLGANGILGVGPEPFDCGLNCDVNGPNSSPPPVYYLCSSSGNCTATFVSCGSICGDPATSPNVQVTHPVFNFSSVDNNGVLLQLPAVSGETATVNGSLIFGIGTESNNGLGSATILTLDLTDSFTTNLPGQTLSGSFIDSGSNGLFFPQLNSLPNICSDNSSWYCPPSNTPYTATNIGANNVTSTVNFSVDNFDTVTTANPNDFAFSNLAGPSTGGFDWGLPFFYGRNVFTAIDGTAVGNVPGPFYAY
jgi:hypothetical protein